MIDANDTFDGTWPFAPHFFAGSGFSQHYVDENVTADKVFLCLHGEPTWGYLYRNFIPRLAKLGRVVVPDHMGFGKSETPQDQAYTIETHTRNLERLILELDLKNITLVVQDWGGPIGGAIACLHPERVERFCIMNTLVGGRPPKGAPSVKTSAWFQWVNSPAFEPTVSNMGSNALSVIKRIGFERTAHVDETWIRAYSAPFPTPADCIAALSFPQCIANEETVAFLTSVRTPEALATMQSKPAMYVHGEEDRAFPMDWVIGCFRDLWPDGPVVTLPGVGHFIQEDAPETAAALVSQFFQMTQ